MPDTPKQKSKCTAAEEMAEMQRAYYFGNDDPLSEEEECDSSDEEDNVKMQFSFIRTSAKPLHSIVELNFEASSDEDGFY